MRIKGIESPRSWKKKKTKRESFNLQEFKRSKGGIFQMRVSLEKNALFVISEESEKRDFVILSFTVTEQMYVTFFITQIWFIDLWQ